MELAPLLGLSDAIVDIVETGSTLKENGLEAVSYTHLDFVFQSVQSYFLRVEPEAGEKADPVGRQPGGFG